MMHKQTPEIAQRDSKAGKKPTSIRLLGYTAIDVSNFIHIWRLQLLKITCQKHTGITQSVLHGTHPYLLNKLTIQFIPLKLLATVHQNLVPASEKLSLKTTEILLFLKYSILYKRQGLFSQQGSGKCAFSLLFIPLWTKGLCREH